jgi:hypothetical protein
VGVGQITIVFSFELVVEMLKNFFDWKLIFVSRKSSAQGQRGPKSLWSDNMGYVIIGKRFFPDSYLIVER